MAENAAGQPEHPLGVSLMDDDHAAIEAMLAKVAEVPDSELEAMLTGIAAEVTDHFAREEELMRARGVPVLFCHMAQHQRILDLMKAAQGFAAKGDTSRLRAFLTDFLPAEIEGHINSVDRLSARYINGEITTQATQDLRLPERDVLNLG